MDEQELQCHGLNSFIEGRTPGSSDIEESLWSYEYFKSIDEHEINFKFLLQLQVFASDLKHKLLSTEYSYLLPLWRDSRVYSESSKGGGVLTTSRGLIFTGDLDNSTENIFSSWDDVFHEIYDTLKSFAFTSHEGSEPKAIEKVVSYIYRIKSVIKKIVTLFVGLEYLPLGDTRYQYDTEYALQIRNYVRSEKDKYWFRELDERREAQDRDNKHFEKMYEEYDSKSEVWLMAGVGAIFLLFLFLCLREKIFEIKGDDAVSLYVVILTQIYILSLFLWIIAYCFRMSRANANIRESYKLKNLLRFYQSTFINSAENLHQSHIVSALINIYSIPHTYDNCKKTSAIDMSNINPLKDIQIKTK